MAKTRDYMDYLDEKIEIAPANSQEEYQAAEAIAGVMDDHGLEPTIEEFEAHPFGKIMPHVLVILLLISTIVCGVTEGPVHIVLLLLALGIAGLLIFAHFGTNVFENFGPSVKSQNVVGVHYASGEKVVKGSRPIVIVAHYDTPREGLLWRAPFANAQATLMRIKTPCIMAVAVTLLVQALVFLPAIVRTFFWIVGILAALPPLVLAILTIMGNSGNCTYGSNDNKSSIAAMLSIMNKVRPVNDRVAGENTGRSARRRANDEPPTPPAPIRREVVEEVKGVRHGKAMLSSLGILPPSCEIVYEEPKVRIVEEPVVATPATNEAFEEEVPASVDEQVDAVAVAEAEAEDQYDSYDEDSYDEEFEDDEAYEEDHDEEVDYDEDEYDDEEYDDEEDVFDQDESFDEDEDAEPLTEEDQDEVELVEQDEDAWYEGNEDYEEDFEDEEYEDDSYERTSIGAWFSERLQGIKSFFASRKKGDESSEGDWEDDWEDEEAYEDDDFSEEWMEEDDSDEDELQDAGDEEQGDEAYEEDEIEEEPEDETPLEDEYDYDNQGDAEPESAVEEFEAASDEPVWEESDQDELLTWDDDADLEPISDEEGLDEAEEVDEVASQQYEDVFDDEYDADYDDEYDDRVAFEEEVDSGDEEISSVKKGAPSKKPFDYLDLDNIDGEIVGYEEYEEIVYVEDEEEVFEDDVEIVYEGEDSQAAVDDEDLYPTDAYEEDNGEEVAQFEETEWQQEVPIEAEDSDDDYDEYDESDDEFDEYEDDADIDPYGYADEQPTGPTFAQKIRGAFRKRRVRDGEAAFISDIEDEEDTTWTEDAPENEDLQPAGLDEEAFEEDYVDETYEDDNEEWLEEEDYDEEGAFDDEGEEYYEDEEVYEDEEPYEPPVDPNLLHFDREEDQDIVPRDTTGLDTYAESYDLIDATPREESDREAPKPIDDPSWGTSTYQPPRPVMNIARRAALFDLPDPSAATVDPLDDSYGYDDNAHQSDAQTDSSSFWSDGNGGAPTGWKGGATMRADLRDSDEPIVMDEQDLQEAILELGDEFLASHDIWFVATGASELDHAGIKAFITEHKRDIRGSFLVNLEAIGAGALTVITREGLRLSRNADRRLVRMLATIAQDLHISLDTASYDWDETDAATSMRSRVRSVTIAGLDDNNLPMYSHTADDVPENVDPKQVDSVVRLVTELIRRS